METLPLDGFPVWQVCPFDAFLIWQCCTEYGFYQTCEQGTDCFYTQEPPT